MSIKRQEFDDYEENLFLSLTLFSEVH